MMVWKHKEEQGDKGYPLEPLNSTWGAIQPKWKRPASTPSISTPTLDFSPPGPLNSPSRSTPHTPASIPAHRTTLRMTALTATR